MTKLNIKLHHALLVTVFVLSCYSISHATHPTEANPGQEEKTSEEKPKMFEIEFDADAYYTSLDLYMAVTGEPIPYVGEKSELEIYKALITKSLQPRFFAFEASVNPMPCLGVYIKEHDRDFYERAQVSGSLNWVKALTAGFEEPYALSVFFGNVVDFDTQDRKDSKGKGQMGLLVSGGDYHIKDNELVHDNWREFELKLKGDRKSYVKKLNWSFRVGAKFHENPDITDIMYLSLRRSRVDYKPSGSSIFNNSGFEYTYDMDMRRFDSIRNYFFVDKKWPSEKRRMAFDMAVGFVWESAKKYSGALSTGREKDNIQFIIRPNIEF